MGVIGNDNQNSTTVKNCSLQGTLNTTGSSGRCGSLFGYIYNKTLVIQNVSTSVYLISNTTNQGYMGMIGVTQISTITITKLTVTSTLNSPITYRTAILIGEQGGGSLVLQNSTITSTVTNGALTYLQACGPGIVVGITDGIGNSISIQNVVANINMAFNDSFGAIVSNSYG